MTKQLYITTGSCMSLGTKVHFPSQLFFTGSSDSPVYCSLGALARQRQLQSFLRPLGKHTTSQKKKKIL